jgi:uncharacterized protein YndB with AHSA1/START domain
MRAPDGQEFWNGGEYHEIVLHEKIVYSMHFSDPEGKKVEPAHSGIEHEAIDDVQDVITFEDLGNGRTKLTDAGREASVDLPLRDGPRPSTDRSWRFHRVSVRLHRLLPPG